MTEYWVSQGNKWCDFCKIYISNNPASIRNHELGQRHKDNVAKRLATMRKENAAKEKEQKEAARALEQIEAVAHSFSIASMAENKTTVVADVVPTVSWITEHKLTASNYLVWAKDIRIYLQSIEKDDHLTKDPPYDSTRQAWLRDDAKLFLQIRNSISSELNIDINHCEFVKELMDYLDFVYFGKGNISHPYDVCKAFFRPEKHDKSLTTYFMEFKKAYEEFNTLFPLSTDIKVQMTQREHMAVMNWLSGLRPKFENVKSQILADSKVKSFQEVHARILCIESAHSQPTNNVSALIGHGALNRHSGNRIGGASNNGHNQELGVVCYYCHEPGHLKHNCKKLQKKLQRS